MDNYKNPVTDNSKLEDKYQLLVAKNLELAAKVTMLEGVVAMPHKDKLIHDVNQCSSQLMVEAICQGHIIEAMYATSNTFDMFEMLKEFHHKFKLDYNGQPRVLPKKLLDFRVKFLQEELDEYIKGIEDNSLEDQFDALIDLVYVALGNAYLQGFDFNEGFRRVHCANMKKIRAATALDSKRGNKHDVIKPRHWSPPYLRDLV